MRPAPGILILLAGVACAAPASEAGRGAHIYRQCVACHAREPGRNTPAGPTLHRIVGRSIATEAGFDYSPAMRRFAVGQGRWTTEQLDRFLADPEAVVPGTEMGFAGIPDPADRRALIDWLGAGQPAGD